MTGAMYAAIAGLKTHMSKMNVIGHNIANVNTNGYKTQRTIFKDAMYTMYRNGSNGTATVGGMNPAQIGYGSQVSTIDLKMTTGTYAPGNPMDCMIDGDGFFLVGDKDTAEVIDPTNPNSFKSLDLTRVGDFFFGPDGYLVDGNGSCVYGFLSVGVNMDGQPIMSDQLVPIRLPRMEKVAIALRDDMTGAFENIEINDEIPADDLAADQLLTTPTLVEGQDFEYRYVVRYPVASTDGTGAAVDDGTPITSDDLLTANVKSVPLDDYWPQGEPVYEADGTTQAQDANGNLLYQRAAENPLAFAQLDSISIDPLNGRISGTLKDTDEAIVIGYLAMGNVTNPQGVTHDGGFYYKCADGAGDLQISMLGGAQETLQVIGGGTLTHVNGSLAGEVEDPNNQGVMIPVELSRKAEIGSAGNTRLYTGGLEGSNVDLATEISEMITTQRGYQANTRIITVTDTMLEELVNMKR